MAEGVNLQRVRREGNLKGNSCFICILKNEKCLYPEAQFKGEKENSIVEPHYPKEG